METRKWGVSYIIPWSLLQIYFHRIPQDMKFASLSNYKKLLVLSGLTKKEDLENWNYSEEYAPDYYIENLETLYKAIKNKLK